MSRKYWNIGCILRWTVVYYTILAKFVSSSNSFTSLGFLCFDSTAFFLPRVCVGMCGFFMSTVCSLHMPFIVAVTKRRLYIHKEEIIRGLCSVFCVFVKDAFLFVRSTCLTKELVGILEYLWWGLGSIRNGCYFLQSWDKWRLFLRDGIRLLPI